jgi:hypothetical protein
MDALTSRPSDGALGASLVCWAGGIALERDYWHRQHVTIRLALVNLRRGRPR